MQREPCRLVIWDLDDTFWRGALTEGGIDEYLVGNHQLVIELAKRGIVSSICSKNDFAAVERILRDHGLWEYFVFPSINWEPKGSRLRQLVETVGLRPSTIVFVDDNHGNRAEAMAAVPGLVVLDEGAIGGFLSDPLFRGKEDAKLTRLKQYKLLERRRRAQESAGSENFAFLRNSDIRVSFEFDVVPHIDRVIELINRTNQLNYTKRRLPDDPVTARREMMCLLEPFWHQAALVRVTDRFGDYGFVGFFLRTNGQGSDSGRLIHYCFSCRVLGMYVEQWVYDQIGRPSLYVEGEVLTDLSAPRTIDWIRLASTSGGTDTVERDIPEVRLRGGCEMDSLAHYFSIYTRTCRRESNETRSPFFIVKDCSHHLLTPSESTLESSFFVFAGRCGYKREDFESVLFEPCPPGTLLIYASWNDDLFAYRHAATGLHLSVLFDVEDFPLDMTEISSDQVERLLAGSKFAEPERARVRDAVDALRGETDGFARPEPEEVRDRLRRIFRACPSGARLIALAKDEVSVYESQIEPDAAAIAYNEQLRLVASECGVKLFEVGDFVHALEERKSPSHFNRIVYFRLAQAIIAWARATNAINIPGEAGGLGVVAAQSGGAVADATS